MKALVFERKPAKLRRRPWSPAGSSPGRRRARSGPLRARATSTRPSCPGPAGCGCGPGWPASAARDLATIDGTSSRYFEPIVSFPFVPGHEVVGDLDDGTPGRRSSPCSAAWPAASTRVCDACADGRINRCERLAFGHLEPGLQTGFCDDTGGGWSTLLVAHESPAASPCPTTSPTRRR